MKAAYLDAADPEAVSHAVREVLERRGALVSEHLHSRVRFRGLQPSKHVWSREGYVGIYQHVGERDVEVRLLLRARWPWRILWTVAAINVLAALTTVVLNPSGTTWFLVAILGALGLLVAGILYIQTWRPVRHEERELMDAFEAEFQQDIAGARVLDQEERALARLEEELAGEIERRRVARERKAEAAVGGGAGRAFKLPKFSLRPGATKPPSAAERELPVQEASDDELARRRAELLRRKAELEAKRREQGEP